MKKAGRDLGNDRDVRNGILCGYVPSPYGYKYRKCRCFLGLIFFVVRCFSRFDCFNQCGPSSPNTGLLQRGLIVRRLYHFYPLLSVVFGFLLPAQPLHFPEPFNHNVPLTSMQVMVNGKMMLRQTRGS